MLSNHLLDGYRAWDHKVNNVQGVWSILSVPGPMARSPDSVSLFCQAVLRPKLWQSGSKVIPLPWAATLANTSVIDSEKKLTVGIIFTDHILYPTLPVLRPLETVGRALMKAGHRLIDWTSKTCTEEASSVLIRCISRIVARGC